MITVCVTFTNGKSLVTPINTDLAGAEACYLNRWFNLGSDADDMQKAVKVEAI